MTFKAKTREFTLRLADEKAFVALEKYVELIEAKNQVMNLTGFTGDTLWKEGIYESLVSLYESFGDPGARTMVDIGAGAGFPSIPFKIVFPHLRLTIIEPLKKRAAFLSEVIAGLSLDVSLLIVRAEEFNAKQFDLITARAVAELQILVEISHHLGKADAQFAFLKGPSVFAEMSKALTIMSKLGVDAKVKQLNPDLLGKNLFVVKFCKTRATLPGYPRPWAKIIAKN